MGAKIGYCSLACGSDILFAEAMTEAGGEVSAWLPFSKEDFIETSVGFAGDRWIERFEKLFRQSHVTFITEESYGGYDDLFSFQSNVIFGSAVIRSSMNHTKPSLLTVLSETDLHRKEGGTRDTVNRWPYHERHVNINPDHFLTQTGPTGRQPAPRTTIQKTIDRPVLYIVCADLPGIPENDQRKIWTAVQEKMNALVLAPVTFEVQEALVASFNSIAGAIELSQIILELIDLYHRTPKLRISLYASPAWLEPDPDEDHKKLAARSHDRLKGLHSQIQPGTLYALARFASVLALDINKYTMDYAGLIPDGPRQHEIYSVRINNH